MGQPERHTMQTLLAVGLLVALVACTPGSDLDLGLAEEVPDESVDISTDIASPVFTQPTTCVGILPASAVSDLAAQNIELTQGPGSGNSEPIFVEGQTPEELVGGISCGFSVPGDEDEDAAVYILLSVAPVDPGARPGVIADLLDQKLNVGQTPDGALTYWIWGDEVIVPALHNSLYPESWYSALIQPGGRGAYDQGLSLVQAMRTETTG